MANSKRYIIISPAKNEGNHIEKTIQSVVNQTLRPLLYFIVSDASTDATDEIASRYATRYDFIKYLRRESTGISHFGSKVHAFNYAYSYVKFMDFGFIGNLDADVSFEPDYFAKVIEQFESEPRLGLAGGLICHVMNEKNILREAISKNNVAGAVQLFRKECFEEINGYIPLALGGIDTAAEIVARSKGWSVRTIDSLQVLHWKPMKTGNKSLLKARFVQGMSNFVLGYHPLFHFMSCILRMTKSPLLVNGLWMLAGYLYALFNNYPHELPPDVVGFLRKEQLNRLYNLPKELFRTR